MQDQVILRVQIPGGHGIAVSLARLLEPKKGKAVIDFTPLDDYTVALDLGLVPAGPYLLAINITDHPTLHFSIKIEGSTDRRFDFVQPTPACATISVQQVSAGPSASRRIHMVHFALPPKHEAVVLVAGADLKGDTKYVKSAKTWRDDLYHGRTDLGDEPDQRITRGVHDHTVVSIFDFHTGYLEKQIKGTRGWHTMYRALQGKVPPDIARPKDDDALDRRQAADSISIVDVYRHIADLGRARRGCLRQLHFFAHAYLRGPVLLNTSDWSDSDLRDPTDKDPRNTDFLPVNLAQYSSLPDAFDSGTYVKNWGCFGSEMKRKLRAVAGTKTLDQEVKVKGQPYSSARAIEDLRAYTFPNSYMIAICRDLRADGWSLPPGTSSSYKESSKYHYFYAKQDIHGAVLGWYERFFGCKRDLSGAVSYRTLS